MDTLYWQLLMAPTGNETCVKKLDTTLYIQESMHVCDASCKREAILWTFNVYFSSLVHNILSYWFDSFCFLRHAKAWKDYQMALKVWPQHLAAKQGNSRWSHFVYKPTMLLWDSKLHQLGTKTDYKLVNRHLITCRKGNSEFCFLETLSEVEGKQNSLFPHG